MSKFSTKEDAGESSGEQNRGITGEGRFATRTESPGFESFNERIVSSDTREEEEGGRHQSPTAEMWSGSRRSKMMLRKSSWLDTSDFPPLLSILNMNGRPRFDFIKTRDNGRLQMTIVPSERPEVVALQTPPMRMNKRLQMLLIKTDDDQDQDQDQDHDHEDQ